MPDLKISPLAKQEQFETEVLEKLNSTKALNKLVFIGGTMLRLCYGLNRFSVDLDFWIDGRTDKKKLYREIKGCLNESYQVKDSADKFYTMLFEIKSKDYPRSLKIEIRKETKKIRTGQAIAYSRYSNNQVFVKTASLEDMMRMKIEALLDRKEIRDAFDIEFLIKKGIELGLGQNERGKILAVINGFGKMDYKVKLASLLEPKERNYYTAENFKILKSALAPA